MGYALVLAAAAWFGHAASLRLGLLTHGIDLALFSLFVYLTEGAASPFFTYFIFAIVAATLRWQSRGALWTAAVAVVAFSMVGLYAAKVIGNPTFELDRFFTQSAYLVVLASLLGALSAYETRRRDEIASLAAWPPAVGNEPGALLRQLLGSTARILNAPRTLLAWEERGQPWVQFGAWSVDAFTLWREPHERYDPLVAEPLKDVSFLSPDVSQRQAAVLRVAGAGLQTWRGAPVHDELRSRFRMKALLCVRVGGEWVRGRLFSLDQRALTADDLVLGELVAGHLAASLDHIVVLRRLRQAAAEEARARLSRDLHDGVLQSLTGAALKLETVQRLWETHQPAARERLSEIQHLLAQEQRGLRFLIRDAKLNSGPSTGGTSLSER
ncbi:MAG: histidine kinase, partial [Burkholderiales bacterium]